MTERKVAIVGFTTSNRSAPFDDPGWEKWGLNALYDLLPGRQWQRWFELHKREVNLADEGMGHLYQLSLMRCSIYMQRCFPDIPTSIEYPLSDVFRMFRSYLTSSFSYMVALAILEGVSEIGVWGVDAADEEWGWQRPSLEYLLGYAEGNGIKVTIPGTSSLLRAPFLYGYQEREEAEYWGRLSSLQSDYEIKWQRAQQARNAGELEAARYSGAIAAIKELRNEWRLPYNFERLAEMKSNDNADE